MQTLGMEHTEWGSGPLDPGEEEKLPCGYGIETSCRDLARVGQASRAVATRSPVASQAFGAIGWRSARI